VNILFVSSQFPNRCEPNRGVFSLQIARELARMADLQVIAPIPTLGALRFLDGFKRYRTNLDIPDLEYAERIPVHHPKYFALPGMGFLHPLSEYRPLQAVITSLHRSWGIDAVNCHWLFPDGVAVQSICRRLRIPVVLTALGTDLNSFSTYLMRKSSIRNALVKADTVTVLSGAMVKRCLALGVDAGKVKLIPNGVDLQKFTLRERSGCRAKLSMPGHARAILFVGSLVPVKGVADLLHAFALLRQKMAGSEVRLYLLGSGFLADELRRLAEKLEIGTEVVFTGPVPHAELPEWMNAADCLCLPSLSEGHPNVVMEALACGLPVVASAVGSIPDYVNDRCGRVVSPGNPQELCDGLISCLSTTYQRDEIRGGVEQMGWNSCAERYFNTMKQLVAGNG